MMRPIMTRAELAGHEVTSFGRDYSQSDDGYDDMDLAERQGWGTLSGWGRDGWDLGEWPYVVISERFRAGHYEMRQTVEGDTTVYRFDSVEDCHAAIDYLFIWYGIAKELDEWAVEGLGAEFDAETGKYTKREGLDAGTLRVPERFRGPFSWSRLDAETAS